LTKNQEEKLAKQKMIDGRKQPKRRLVETTFDDVGLLQPRQLDQKPASFRTNKKVHPASISGEFGDGRHLIWFHKTPFRCIERLQDAGLLAQPQK
jgi:hypothetical protein